MNSDDLDCILNLTIGTLAIIGVLWFVGNAILALVEPTNAGADDPDGYYLDQYDGGDE